MLLHCVWGIDIEEWWLWFNKTRHCNLININDRHHCRFRVNKILCVCWPWSCAWICCNHSTWIPNWSHQQVADLKYPSRSKATLGWSLCCVPASHLGKNCANHPATSARLSVSQALQLDLRRASRGHCSHHIAWRWNGSGRAIYALSRTPCFWSLPSMHQGWT